MGHRVLIIWASVGAGHWSGAQALSEAVAELDPAIEVSMVDAWSEEFGGVLSNFHSIYPIIMMRYPVIWQTLWYASNYRLPSTLSELPVRFLANRANFRRVLEQQQPDLIVCIAPCLGNLISDAVRASGREIPIAVVVSDMIAVHYGWRLTDAVWTSVPTPTAREALIGLGIHPDKVLTCGIPVRKGFWAEPHDRHALRAQLCLPQDKRVVLLVGGGDGVNALHDTTLALLAADLPYHIVVITGRNRSLRDHLTRATRGQPCTVLGYTSNMADWMWASDLLVSKAGSVSIAEAMQCSLPIVLTSCIPGQETPNLRFVTENGLGVVARTPEQVVTAVRSILDDPFRIAAIKQAIRRIHPPHSAHFISQQIVGTLTCREKISPQVQSA